MIHPAKAKYGPNAIELIVFLVIKMCIAVKKRPTTEATKTTTNSGCHPTHAPISANSLKSPWPIPSLPVRNLWMW